MGDQGYLKRLGADLERWAHEGWLPKDVADRLLADAKARVDEKPRGEGLLGGLAGVVIALGVLAVLAANWSAMNGFARIATAFGLLTLTILASGELRARRRVWGAELAGALSAAFFGLSVVVVGQTYHVMANTTGFLALWSVGATVIAIALRSKFAASVAGALAVIWLFSAMGDRLDLLGGVRVNFEGGLHTRPFGAALGLTALFALAALWRSRAVLHFVVFGLSAFVGWIVLEPWSIFLHRDAERLAQAGLALLAAGAGALTEFLWRTRQVWGTRLVSGWMAWAGGYAFLLAAWSAVDDQAIAGLAWSTIGLLISAAVVTYGAAPGRRWIQAGGASAFLGHGALMAFNAGDPLLSGLIMIAAGLGLWLAIALAPRIHRFVRGQGAAS